MKNKYGTIQIDVDEIWAIEDFVGKSTNSNWDRIYQRSLPLLLDLLNQYSLKSTFFIVAGDAMHRENKNMIRRIDENGHEVANHTFSHPQGFSAFPLKQKKKEIEDADKMLSDIIGKKIRGFRSPGYSIDDEILDILEDNEYLYDSSVYPAFWQHIIRCLLSLLVESRVNNNAYGNMAFGLAPLSIYNPMRNRIWKRGSREICELPVTVMPEIRFPFHASVVLLLGTPIFDLGLKLIKYHRETVLNYLLHPFELLYAPELKHIPRIFRLDKGLECKMDMYNYIFTKLKERYTIITSRELVEKYSHDLGDEPF